MNFVTDLLHIVERAHSLPHILDAVARLVTVRLGVARCTVFLLDDQGSLVRSDDVEGVNAGASREQADVAAADAAAQVSAELQASTRRTETASLLAAPMLLGSTLVGAVVLEGDTGRTFSKGEVESLAAICAQLVGVVENARIIGALDRGEPLAAVRVARRPSSEETRHDERCLVGIGASPGVAIGPAVFRGAYRLDLSAHDLLAGPASTERARLQLAIETTRGDLSKVQAATARELDEEHALIFASHLLLLNDPMLSDNIARKIERGLSAPSALNKAFDEFESALRAVPDAYLRERIEDINDVRARLLEHLLGRPARASSGVGIVLTRSVRPSLVVELNAEGALALVAESGGVTSHGVLLARALGIPVVTGIADLQEAVRFGEALIVDGAAGVLVVRPTEETRARYEEQQRRDEQARSEHARYRHVLARTSDGARVTLLANVGVASDLAVARENGAEGVGLYRTEFPFMVRDGFPTRAEQVRIYRKAYEAFPAGPILFRLLDLAGDKFLARGRMAGARSAFHGYRSIRVLVDHPEVLRDQVQALALAAEDRPLRILIPMVSSIDELRRLKALLGQAITDLDDSQVQRSPEIGAMIEVPAAVELAPDIANEVDFLSIGTNDLIQYTLVADREDSQMAAVGDPYHPAILRMISRVIAAARAAEKPVGVCGDIAGRPDMALALIALGIDSLSVVPTAIPRLKQALMASRVEPLRDEMPEILALSDARSVAAALRAHCAVQ